MLIDPRNKGEDEFRRELDCLTSECKKRVRRDFARSKRGYRKGKPSDLLCKIGLC